MNKNRFVSTLVLTLSLLSVVSCVGTQKPDDVDLDSVGYQYSDNSKPIVKSLDSVPTFNITAPKDPLAKDYKDMKAIQDLQTSTNINVTWNHPTSYSLDTTMTGKNLPDAIFHASFTDPFLIQYGVKRNKILKVDEYLQYMPNFKAILDKRPDIKKQIEIDGHIYALPRIEEMGLKDRPNLLFMNKDWLNAAIDSGAVQGVSKDDVKDGLALTLDQFKAALTYFKGLGDNKIPLNMIYNNWQGNIADLYAAYGAYYQPDFKTLINGKIVFDLQEESWRQATIGIHNDFIAPGLLQQKVFEQTQQQFLSDGKNGSDGQPKVGAFYYWEKESVVSNPDQYICLQPLIGKDGKQRINLQNNQEITKGEVVVLSNAHDPKILFTYLDRYYEPWNSATLNYGAIGEAFQQPQEGDNVLHPVTSFPDGQTADDFRLKNAPMGIIGLTKEVFDTSTSSEGRRVEMEPRAKERLRLLELCEKKEFAFEGQEIIPNIVYSSEEINELKRYETNLGTTATTSVYKYLYQGGLENDSEWNSFKDKLTANGVEKIVKINQDAYDRLIQGN